MCAYEEEEGEDESALHMLCDCPGLQERRLILGSRFFEDLDSLRDVSLRGLFEDTGMVYGFFGKGSFFQCFLYRAF